MTTQDRNGPELSAWEPANLVASSSFLRSSFLLPSFHPTSLQGIEAPVTQSKCAACCNGMVH
ncbi:hypothetical protein K474DRAFT_1316387 [Panus rudis PR-1116 ss-1]|nr:hypothetical protein K474DRAFT_1316387 [Panus rudis PR-1116 ss-1]